MTNQFGPCGFYAVHRPERETLTIANAQAYAQAYAEDCGASVLRFESVSERVDADGHFIELTAFHDDGDALSWTIWREPSARDGLRIYGEC